MLLALIDAEHVLIYNIGRAFNSVIYGTTQTLQSYDAHLMLIMFSLHVTWNQSCNA